MTLLLAIACNEHAPGGGEASRWHQDEPSIPNIGREPASECQQTDRDGEVDCPGCGLDLDATLTCDTSSYLHIRLGPTTHGAWFASCRPGYFYTLEAGEAPVSTVRQIQWNGSECDVLVHPDGVTDLVVNETVDDGDWEGGLTYAGAAGREFIVEQGTRFVTLLGIALVGDFPTVCYVGDDLPMVATRGLDGSWTSIPFDLPVDGVSWQAVTTGPDDAPVSFGLRSSQHLAFIAGAEHAIGREAYGGGVARPPPEGVPEGAADAAFVRLSAAGLQVGFVRPEGVVEHTLGDTQPAWSNCEEPNSCEGSCHELYEGLEGESSFHAARATDGGVWVAWFSTSFDRMLTYEASYNEDVGQMCDPVVSDDYSVATLHLAHVAEDGTVTERFAMEGPRPVTIDGPQGAVHVATGFGRVALAYAELAFQARVIALPE